LPYWSSRRQNASPLDAVPVMSIRSRAVAVN
jgi:hypothetical protein